MNNSNIINNDQLQDQTLNNLDVEDWEPTVTKISLKLNTKAAAPLRTSSTQTGLRGAMLCRVTERAAEIRSVEKDGLPVCAREKTNNSMSPPGGKINRPKTVRNDSCPKCCD